MKELTQSLKLSKLSEIPLTAELKRLDEAILFIQSILDKMILKIDEESYPDEEHYFIDDKLYFIYDLKDTDLWCRYDDFWSILECKYQYNYQEISDLIKVVVEEHFKNKVVAPRFGMLLNVRRVEEHFKTK